MIHGFTSRSRAHYYTHADEAPLSPNYELVSPFPNITEGYVVGGPEIDASSSILPRPQDSAEACFAACVALTTAPIFYFNLYTENGVKKCTCVNNYTGLRPVPQAQIFISCAGGPALGRISLGTKTIPRVTTPGKLVKLTARVKSLANNNEVWNTLGFRVTLPQNVSLVRTKSPAGLKKDAAPMVETNTTTGTSTITWWNMRLGGNKPKDQQRIFSVTVRVNKNAPRNVLLSFMASTFETALASQVPQYCAYGPSNTTVQVKPLFGKQ